MIVRPFLLCLCAIVLGVTGCSGEDDADRAADDYLALYRRLLKLPAA